MATPTFENVDMSKVPEKRRRILEGSRGDVIPFDSNGVINFIMEESTNLGIAMKNFDVFYESMEVVDRGTKLKMKDHMGSTIVVNLENYVQNQIRNYVWDNLL
jgi:hypothetical protein